jgi:cyclophilin family peptidyl-prolyl cis-trans isomerase
MPIASIPPLDPAKRYRVEVETNLGSFTIALAVDEAPKTSASFASLVNDGFFDGTVFHRIVPGFVIQGGDPTGTGTGGPGYKTVEAPPATIRYERGIVAMAETGIEPPGTAGSQFFVVTADDAGLPPDYALLGQIEEGWPVVERIAALGDRTSERPSERVVVQSMRLAANPPA